MLMVAWEILKRGRQASAWGLCAGNPGLSCGGRLRTQGSSRAYV
jgi:hypothetical protein